MVTLAPVHERSPGLRSLGAALLALALAGCEHAVAQLRPLVSSSEPYLLDIGGQKIPTDLIRLSVPERHHRPGGARIELALVRLPHVGATADPPILYLAGGPGGSAIALASGPRGEAFLRMREAGDVILLDQRGVGLSRPNLDCEDHVDIAVPIERASALEAMKRAARQCAGRFRARGVELAAYNVVESADDIAMVRRALGADKIILWGVSYGTQLGFAVLRRHGEIVDRAIFAGVEGPDHTLKRPGVVERQLKALEDMIGADAILRERYPDLTDAARRVLEAAARAPFQVSLATSPGSAPSSVSIGRFELEQALAGMIGTRSGLQNLPAFVYGLDRRYMNSPYVRIVASQILAVRKDQIGSAMAFATDCSSGASRARRARIAREERTSLVRDIDFPMPGICEAWEAPQLPSVERSVVRSGVPILLVSGSLDGQTPVDNMEDVATGLPNAVRLIIRNSGHGNDLLVGAHEIMDRMLEFVRTGAITATEVDLPPLRIP